MMKTLSLHMQTCTFCEISIEFYSTSTEAPFGQLIKQKVSKKLLLLITIFIIMKLHFVVWYIHHEMYARFILDRGHIDNTHVCGKPIIVCMWSDRVFIIINDP
jgi:hypothetical protein